MIDRIRILNHRHGLLNLEDLGLYWNLIADLRNLLKLWHCLQILEDRTHWLLELLINKDLGYPLGVLNII